MERWRCTIYYGASKDLFAQVWVRYMHDFVYFTCLFSFVFSLWKLLAHFFFIRNNDFINRGLMCSVFLIWNLQGGLFCFIFLTLTRTKNYERVRENNMFSWSNYDRKSQLLAEPIIEPSNQREIGKSNYTATIGPCELSPW